MKKRSSRGNTSSKKKRMASLTTEQKETAEKLGCLNQNDDEDNNSENNLVCMYNQNSVNSYVSDTGIVFATIFLTFIVTNCISGGIFSQWKSAAIIVGSAGIILLCESVFLVFLKGSGYGIKKFLQWNYSDLLETGDDPRWIFTQAVRECFFSFSLGLPFIEMLGSRVSVDFPVIKGAAIASFFAALYHIAVPLLAISMGGAVMFYYCRPMDERMSECSLEEKKRFTDLMFDNIRYNLRVPYPRICREAPNYFVQVGYSIYPQMGRTFSLLHYAVTLGSIMIRLFAVLIIIQEHLMRIGAVSKYLSWRVMSYILGVVTAGLIVGVFQYYDLYNYWAEVLTPLEISNSSAVVAIIQILNIIAVFWLYGSYNFLNDIYVTEHKVKVSGVIFAFWCQYLLPLALLSAVIVPALHLSDDRYFWSDMNEKLKTIDARAVLYPMVAVYSLLVVIPLFACCKQFGKAIEEPNLKKRFSFKDLKFPKKLASMFMSKCNCKK
ncbi:uncharacterized protein LOC142345431 isoform X2 [Convolutriloba macropyga]|uniref:uncharacterized protein LOC142345431 isoform X2 n=1 Tax=Convolutriloba macropyga TaxID=536237 RepID=UPI003F524E52